MDCCRDMLVSKLLCSTELSGALDKIESRMVDFIGDKYQIEVGRLEYLHHHFKASEINEVRMGCYEEINKIPLKSALLSSLIPWIRQLVGSDSMVQKKINLSIHMPGDDSSLLPLHVDAWDGESPYEWNFWLPLTDCADSSSIWFLSESSLEEALTSRNELDYLKICRSYERAEAIKIRRGEFLVFSPVLPHGNKINISDLTRVSLNLRVKSSFAPVLSSTKGLSSFYEIFECSKAASFAARFLEWKRAVGKS